MTETLKPSKGLSLPGLENIQAKFRTAGQALRGGSGKQDNEDLRKSVLDNLLDPSADDNEDS